jgi:hypothetical protein
VRPLLAARCWGCHGERASSALRLDSREGILRGGMRGPAIAAGNPAASLLLQAVRGEHVQLRMPPDGKLTAAEIGYLEKWIAEGGVWPAALPAKPAGNWWAFAELAALAGSIDGHVRAVLAAKRVAPNPMAAERTRMLRLYVDLTGIRPTAEQAREFLGDKRPGKWERLVDGLLATPAFGERWGRHWLDVARFGESDFSGTAPQNYPQAWRYRDWVIEAFNKDMPYDGFVRAQIAGDLQPGGVKEIGGLGLFGFGPWYYGIAQPPQARADERHDQVDMVTRGFLGLTAACARCHDHKYDPIPQADYYALAGVFASSAYKKYPLAPEPEVRAYDEARARIRAIEKEHIRAAGGGVFDGRRAFGCRDRGALEEVPRQARGRSSLSAGLVRGEGRGCETRCGAVVPEGACGRHTAQEGDRGGEPEGVAARRRTGSETAQGDPSLRL